MNTTKKQSISGAIAAILILFFVGGAILPAHAATSNVTFDPNSGTLSVSGTCASTFVIVVIRRSSDNSIWGSSNPDCVNGTYSYSIVVPPSDRTGANFVVAAMDAGSADQSMSSTKPSGSNSIANITFAAPAAVTAITAASITLDTSSLAADPNSDTSILDGILQDCFGIATSAVNAVESSVVAAMQLFAKMFTILPGGSISVPTGQNQISGQGSLPAGSSEVFIANTAVTSSSQVIVTPTSPTQVPLAVTQIVDGSGFDVGAISPQQIPVSFTWLIIGTYATGAPSSAGTPVSNQSASVQIPAPVVLTEVTTSSTDDAATSTGDVATSTSTDITDIATTTIATTTDDSSPPPSAPPADDATSTDATSTSQ